MTCKEWLRANDYDDVADLTDRADERMHARGSKTRRNWWEKLAGGKNGKPLTCEGIEFPVLRAAQLHQNLEVTPNAICRNLNEIPPPPRTTGRWPQKKKSKRRQIKTKAR